MAINGFRNLSLQSTFLSQFSDFFSYDGLILGSLVQWVLNGNLAQEGEAEIKLYPVVLVTDSIVCSLPGQDLGTDSQTQA